MRAGLLGHAAASVRATPQPPPLIVDDTGEMIITTTADGTTSPALGAAAAVSSSPQPTPVFVEELSPRASPISPAPAAAVSEDVAQPTTDGTSSPPPPEQPPRSPSPTTSEVEDANEEPTPVASGSEAEDGHVIIVTSSSSLLPEICVSPPPLSSLGTVVSSSPLPNTAGEAGEALRDLLVSGQWDGVWRVWRGCRHLLAQVSIIENIFKKVFPVIQYLKLIFHII